ncbi:MAG TPA: FtsX-like permease family protein, partial [Chryseolinea sp.]|nr:FtsX-like permease family protein [Chryseolinea sp.]
DYKGNNSSIYASSVPAMGPALKEGIPEIKDFTRFVPVLTVKPYCVFTYYENNKVKYAGNADHGFYADSSFLKIFSFPILQGSSNPLSQSRSIAITKSFAQKVFGDLTNDKIIGRSIEVDNEDKKDHIVTAILEDLPTNSHIQFDYLISYSTINSDRLEGNLGWSQFYTYVLTHAPVTSARIEPKLKQLLEKLYGKESRISIFLQPLEKIYLTSKLREELNATGSSQQLIFLTIIAYAILLMAWINYINMFLARALERANEIGVKKVLGSSRIHLIVQFFAESMIITILSFVLTFLIVLIVQQPFETWLGKDISSIIMDRVPVVLFVFAGVVLGSICAGLYPALILSAHNPVNVLGVKHQSSGRGIFFKNGLVYFQFAVSFVIVASTLIVNRQINFMRNSDLGMEIDECITVRSPGNMDSTYQSRVQSYKERLLKYPHIKNVSFTTSTPGKPITTSGGVQRVVGPELEGNNVFILQVDEHFLNTYNIRLIAGKNFSDNLSGVPCVVLNEAALQTLKFESPAEALGHRIHWQRKEYEVIGVISNYNHLFLKEAFEPILLSFNAAATGFITLKIQHGHYDEALKYAKREMQALFPGSPFEYNFLETTYDNQYKSIQQFHWLAKYFSFLAILIACFGLFSLSFYTVQRRIKEIAVRKVFGATVRDVLLLLSKNYFKIALISCSAGSSLTFYVMNEWLANFAFAIRLGALDFLIPLLAITLIILCTISYNCIRTSFATSSKSLKHD